MMVLGFDPGPADTGHALLRSGGAGGRPAFVSGGRVSSKPPELVALIGRCAMLAAAHGHAFVVAVEWVHGYAYHPARSAALHDTASVAGMIRGLAHGVQAPVETLPASEWRKHLVGKGNASDALVKRAVTTLVAGWPDKSNAHVRDAGGLAFVVLQRRASAVARATRKAAAL